MTVCADAAAGADSTDEDAPEKAEEVAKPATIAAPILVLDSIALAQLNVPYDTGATEYNDVTTYQAVSYTHLTLPTILLV